MPELSPGRRRALLLTLTVTVGIYVLTVTLANVILPQLQGAFAATPDQITWVVTSNLLASAIATPMSGWLDARFGRRRTMLWCSAGFIAASIACGLATSLEQLVIFRAFQGFLGAPLLPLSQAIITMTYPRTRHTQVLALWSMGVTVASIIAPLVGGHMAEDYSWRWVFLMIVPVAVISFIALWIFVRDPSADADRGSGLDWIGFLCLAVSVAALQLMLDRGQRLDWFDSPEIVIEAIIATAAFYLFVAHVLTSNRPFLNPVLLLDRNYAVGIVLGFIFGMLYFTTMVLQPTMLQEMRGFPDSLIGTIQASRAVGVLGGSIILLAVLSRTDPRLVLALGFLLQAMSGYAISGFDVNMTVFAVTATTMLQGIGVGMMWSPILVVTFATLAPRHVPEAASVFHLLRNIGSSVHIALTVTLVVRSGTANYAELVQALNPFNETLVFADAGWSIARIPDLALLAAETGRQASMIGYLNGHYAYALAAVAVIPVVFLARRPGA